MLPSWTFLIFLPLWATGSRIDDLLDHMTVEQKIGQMTQIDISVFLNSSISGGIDYDKLTYWINEYHIGSILNSPFSGGTFQNDHGWDATTWRNVMKNIQAIATESADGIPIIYGIDSIHGANYVKGATLFPQQINSAASFNTTTTYLIGSVTARDTLAAGLSWMFSPVLGLALQPLWPRFYETFGEDPYLAAQMATAIVTGLQTEQPGSFPTLGAACMKHFIAYSDPESGHDRAPVMLPDIILKELYMPSFTAAVEAGVMTAMESYQEVGGVPMASSFAYLTKLLRHDMHFRGVLVTDYNEIKNLHSWHSIADSNEAAVNIAMSDTTIDMSMVPTDTSFYTSLLSLVEEGLIPVQRLDASVRRILELKERLGLLDNPIPPLDDAKIAMVGQQSDIELSYVAARDSITLLKNENAALPISSTVQRILVTGPTADSLRRQTGGWSIHWQGALDDAELKPGVTILDGIRSAFPNAVVEYVAGPAWNATSAAALTPQEVDLVSSADYLVVCIGEDSYTEKPGDIDDLDLPAGQREYYSRLRAVASAPIITVIISGRPRLLHDIPTQSTAIIHAYLPGPQGGRAVADVLGGYPPSGRIPFTYPKYSGARYVYHHKTNDMCTDKKDPYHYVKCDVEWSFGHGLSYTSFDISDVKLSHAVMTDTSTMTASISVTNSGRIASAYTALLFVFDVYRRVTPEYKLLKKFSKVWIEPGEQVNIEWRLTTEDLKFIGIRGRYTLESGEYRVAVGPDVDCREHADQCASFQLETEATPDSVMSCSSACALLGECMESTECEDMCLNRQWRVDTMECWEAQLSQGISCAQMECYQPFAKSSSSPSSITLPVLLSLLGELGGFILAMVVMRRKQQRQDVPVDSPPYKMLINDENAVESSAL